jgi:undecaprenyl-diphosphatase
MLENINLLWFSMINSNAGLHGWRLELALFCAEWLILLVSIGLLGSSFPSDHGTIMFTVALALAFSRVPAAKRFGRSMLPLAFVVAWARVFLGVHWPMDMLGALAVALGVTLLFQTRLVDGLCALLAASMGTLYRRLLAGPIARGWLRP